MSFFSARSREEFLQQLLESMGRLGGGPLPEGMALFAGQFFAALTLEELAQRRLADLAGCCLEAWQLLEHFEADSPVVRLFSPDHAHNGWQSPHSVVQVLHADMPFLVDSVSMELKRRGYRIHVLQSSVLGARRDAAGKLLELVPRGEGPHEALIHLEIDRCSEQSEQRQLEQAVQESLAQVRLVVADFAAMQARVHGLLDRLADEGAQDADTAEILAFLQWLLDNHFTFLGYEEFSVVAEGEGGRICPVPESLLGLSRLRRGCEGERVSASALAWLRQPQRLAFAKADSLSRVHRPTHPDYVSIRLLDAAGQVQRECRFIGLYTSSVYIESVRRIPCIRGKYDEVMRRAGFDPSGHMGKRLAQVLEVLPRDELFQMPVEELAETAVAITLTQERNAMRLFMRHDPFGHFCYCLVYVPREIYSTRTRLKIEKVLRARLQALDCEFWTWFSESALARVHFILRVDPLKPCGIDAHALEAEVIQSCRRWEDEFSSLVVETLGEAHGTDLLARFQGSYPAGYRERFAPHQALVDMQNLLMLEDGRRLVMNFYQPALQDGQLYCKLYHGGAPLPLSDMLPILENLGLRVLGEYPFPICCQDGSRYWIHDYSFIPAPGIDVEPQQLNQRLQEAFIRIVGGEAESDAFNRLVLSAGLVWREVALLRAYGRYLKQIRLGFDLNYIAATLNQHPAIARDLLALFHLRFQPLAEGEHAGDCGPVEGRIIQALDAVQVLSEDRILRRCFELIRATLRTNYYQQDAQGQPRSYLSFKFDPELIPELPRPAPRFEIFVYSPRFEGVHLRFGRVARGGLRWSDREEDYRTEVLGLVKAQQVKNAVIVPVGAKGGFVPRQLPAGGTRDEVQAEAIACYRLFIGGLLDLTDNLHDGQVLPPAQVRRHDGDDPYLVVAADKGTASFSDIANAVAASYGFWLGDAFASGGSAGYDHKGMAITARGGWVSVQRHFRERGIDVQRDPVTMVGIGDMAGDVFGNGLLRSASVQLVAAFNHQHIFLDPDPDPAISFAERQRLFALPRSTWADYAPALISEGGGVFPRSAKRIAISPQVRARLDISATSLAPGELISAILKAPVDLLWNGGIGTYVKASSESHADVGDKANDALRVNGRELRCKVVGEGGNLGMTQLGRVEYALRGGACNTDFIDNAGGVTCSDHEVNIKILLGEVLHSGDLTMKQRNELLVAMTEDVASAVLDTCYLQAQALSLAERQSRQRGGEFRRLIQDMEGRGRMDRALEFLPAEDELQARTASGSGLTRPELAVLLSWSKIDLKDALLHSSLPDDPGLAGVLHAAFPALLGERFPQAMASHRLRREILAKSIANELIDHMGMTFVQRLRESMGRSDAEIAAAWRVIREVFGIGRLWRQIEALDCQVDAGLQLDLMEELMRAGRSGVRWLLYNRREALDIAGEIAHFTVPFNGLLAQLEDLLDAPAAEQLGTRRSQLMAAGIPEGLAFAQAASAQMYILLSVIEAADMTGQPVVQVAASRFAIGHALELSWYRQQLNSLNVDGNWQALAREALRDELDSLQRTLTINLLQCAGEEADCQARLQGWLQQHAAGVQRWRSLLVELRGSGGSSDYAMYVVANRTLFELVQQGRQ